jgi:hypothetical protein
VYNMIRECSVYRERIVNVCEVEMVRQNLELVITEQEVVHHDNCIDDSENFLPWECSSSLPSLLRAFEFA